MTLSSSDHRGGQAPTRTASELALILPIPLLLIIEGFAQPLFPGTNPAHPSPYVAIVGTRVRSYPQIKSLPLYIHYEQWQAVAVPLLEGNLRTWRGVISNVGDLVTLLNTIYGPGGVISFPIGFEVGFSPWSYERLGLLYGCDPTDVDRVGGKSAEYLIMAGRSVFGAAQDLGY